MSTDTDPTPPVAGEKDVVDTTAIQGVGEMPSPREIMVVVSTLILTGVNLYFELNSQATALWLFFFGLALVFDIADSVFRFHYRKVVANQLLWWLQPHYVVAAILGVIVDRIYPINLTLSFVVSVILGVVISIPIETYYLSLKDWE